MEDSNGGSMATSEFDERLSNFDVKFDPNAVKKEPTEVSEISTAESSPGTSKTDQSESNGIKRRLVLAADREIFYVGNDVYLVIKEENEPYFVREYISSDGKTFTCCQCSKGEENGITFPPADAILTTTEGRSEVYAAVIEAHAPCCEPINEYVSVKWKQSGKRRYRQDSGVLKARKKALHLAVKNGSIQSIMDNLMQQDKPRLESQAAGEKEKSPVPPSAAAALTPQPAVRVFPLNGNRGLYRVIPDGDWEYGLGIRGEHQGMILIKNDKMPSLVREYKLMKMSADGSKKEYYCSKCHQNGRLVKVFVDVLNSGAETATYLKTKPHYSQCKGSSREITANRQRGLEHRYAYARQASNDSTAAAKTRELLDARERDVKIPICDWKFGLSPEGEKNAVLMVTDPANKLTAREYMLVNSVSTTSEVIYRCYQCFTYGRETPAIMYMSGGDSANKVQLYDSTPSSHVATCKGIPWDTLMSKQWVYGLLSDKNKQAANKRLRLEAEIAADRLDTNDPANAADSVAEDVDPIAATEGGLDFAFGGYSDAAAPTELIADVDAAGVADDQAAVGYLDPLIPEFLMDCMDLEDIPENGWSLSTPQRLWVRANDAPGCGYLFTFYKYAKNVGPMFLCHLCQKRNKKTKAFLIEQGPKKTVFTETVHHSRCFSQVID